MHPSDASPGGNECAGVDEGEIFTAGPHDRERAIRYALANRHRLARDERFIRREMARLHDHGVGRHTVSFREHDEVVDNELSSGDAHALPIADDQRTRAREIA